MRQERTVQATIFEVFARDAIGCELKAISQWLDGQRLLVGLVASDLPRRGPQETGRRGLPAEAVLRCALLKQDRQLSYEELAFHLEDSASFRAFAWLPLAWSPKKSVLHRAISAIRPDTCQSRQCQAGQGTRRAGCRLPQEARHRDRGHGQEPLGLSQAAHLPRRDRGRHLLPQACLRFGTLHLA
jgi:IS5 family transposase